MMFSNVIVGIAKSTCSLALSQSFCEVPASLSDLGDLAVGALDPMNHSPSVLPNPLTPRNSILQTSEISEITQTYQVQDIILIEHQILLTNLQRNLYQQEERINNQILGVKGLIILVL